MKLLLKHSSVQTLRNKHKTVTKRFVIHVNTLITHQLSTTSNIIYRNCWLSWPMNWVRTLPQRARTCPENFNQYQCLLSYVHTKQLPKPHLVLLSITTTSIFYQLHTYTKHWSNPQSFFKLKYSYAKYIFMLMPMLTFYTAIVIDVESSIQNQTTLR